MSQNILLKAQELLLSLEEKGKRVCLERAQTSQFERTCKLLNN
jgi:hypothetical protein